MDSLLRSWLVIVTITLASLGWPLAAEGAPTHEVVTGFGVEQPRSPNGGLVAGPDGYHWGLAMEGGAFSKGAVYKVKADGSNWQTVLSFSGNGLVNKGGYDGSVSAGGLMYDGAGFFWGTSPEGGAGDHGTVFKINANTGVLTTVVEFTNNGATNKGRTAMSTLVSDGAGHLWGSTQQGGANDRGTIFKVNTTTGALTTILEFGPSGNTTTGTHPGGVLVNDGAGFIWGTCQQGNNGMLYKINIATGQRTTALRGSDADLEGPYGIVSDGAGNYWGYATKRIGAGTTGAIFKFNISTSVATTVYSFPIKPNNFGANPSGRLVSDGAGFFWGVTSNGGASDQGTLFKINVSTGVLTTLKEFSSSGPVNNSYFPRGPLLRDGSGNFWGTTSAVGNISPGGGTIFKVTAAGVFTTHVTFALPAVSAGADVRGGLVSDGMGSLWGTASAGGPLDYGTVFEADAITGAATARAVFGGNTMNKGAVPKSTLLNDGAGFLWGVTPRGGPEHHGVLFKQNLSTNAHTTVIEFTGNGASNKGSAPTAGLVSDGAGFLWGTTAAGGAGGFGTLFKLETATGVLTTVAEFSGNGASNKGSAPQAALVSDGAGFFWGSTTAGGAADLGTLFKVNVATGALTTVLEFTGNGAANKGRAPHAALASDGAGYFWGVTPTGGTNDLGTLFKVDQGTGELTTVLEFTGNGASNAGALPYAPLMNDGAGYFWGTTSEGGTSGYGTIFKVEIATGTLATVVNFTGNGAQAGSGMQPLYGAILKHTDGNLYGTTAGGGANAAGTIYRLRYGPSPVTVAAAPVSFWSATLKGTVTANGTASTAYFEWGTAADSLTNVTAVQNFGASTSPAAVNQAVTGLSPGVTYYYRLRADNADQLQPQYGAVLSFTTPIPSTNANLSNLVPNSGTLTPAFNAATTRYELTVPYAAATLRVAPTKAHAGASITIDGVTAASGSLSAVKNLEVGTNRLVIAVTAEDQATVKTYAVTVIRAAPLPGDADLSLGGTGWVLNRPGGAINDLAQAQVVQEDGKIVLAGYSLSGSQYNFGLLRYLPDGTLDTTFSNDGKVATDINSLSSDRARGIAVQADGKLVVAGYTVSAANTGDIALVRYNTDGSLDTGFGTGGKVITSLTSGLDIGEAVVIQPDGLILVAASSTTLDFHVLRYETNGVLDEEFGTGGIVQTNIGSGSDSAYSLALQDDGKIVLAGEAAMGANSFDMALVRYNNDGSLDTDFGVDGKVTADFGAQKADRAYSVAVQPDGKIIAAGNSAATNNLEMGLLRVNGDGTLDSTFGTGGLVLVNSSSTNDYAYGVALQSNGKIVVGGHSAGVAFSVYDFTVWRLNPNGSLDSGFGTGGKVVKHVVGDDQGRSVVVLSDGGILVAGASGSVSNYSFALVRFHGASGATVTTQAATEVLNRSATLNGLVNANESAGGGSAAASFEYSADGIAYADVDAQPAEVTGDANVAVSAEVSGLTPATTYYFRVKGSNGAGSTAGVEVSFTTPANNTITTLASLESSIPLSPDFHSDTLSYTAAVPYLTGSLTLTPTLTDYQATMTVNGDAAESGVSTGPLALKVGDNLVSIKVTAEDGVTTQTYSILVTRAKPAPGQVNVNFGGTGKITTSFGSGSDQAFGMAVQPDGKFVVAGRAAGSVNEDFAVARYKQDGSLDGSFGVQGKVLTDLGGEDAAQAVAVQSDGKIVVAGYSLLTDHEFALVRYQPDGTLDGDFGNGGKVITPVGNGTDRGFGVALQGDGKIVVVGHAHNGTDSDIAVVRYLGDGSLDSGFGTGGKVITGYGAGDDSATRVTVVSGNKILVCGYAMSSVSQRQGFAMVRYLDDGGLDAGFGTGGKVFTGINDVSAASGMAVQPDGRILLGGNTGGWFVVTRYDANGVLDMSFATDGLAGYGEVFGDFGDLVLQGNGKILAAGSTFNPATNDDFVVARFLPDGSLDTSFGTSGVTTIDFHGGNDMAHKLAMLGEQDVLLAGQAHNGVSDDFGVARIHVALAPTVVTQAASNLTATTAKLNALVNANGHADGTSAVLSFEWSADGVNFASLAAQPSPLTGSGDSIASAVLEGLQPGTTYHFRGKGVSSIGTTTGEVITFTTLFNNANLASLTLSSGSLSPVFAANQLSYTAAVSYLTEAVTVTPTVAEPHATVTVNGVAVVSGSASGSVPLEVGSNNVLVVSVTAEDGTVQDYAVTVTRGVPQFGDLDLSFNGTGKVISPPSMKLGYDTRLAVQKDGKIVVGATRIIDSSGNSHAAVLRYHAGGAPDLDFGSGGMVTIDFQGGANLVREVGVQSDGKIVVLSGVYPPNSSEGSVGLARFNPDGSPDASFGTDGKVLTKVSESDDARSMAVQSDDKIVVTCGSNTQDSFIVLRYKSSGELDSTFGVGGVAQTGFGPDWVAPWAIGVQSDGKIVVAGTGPGGVLVVRYRTNGTLDTSFGGDGKVVTGQYLEGYAMALQSNGKIVVAGMATFDGEYQSQMLLLRYNSNGNLDATFGASGRVFAGGPLDFDSAAAVVVQKDGKIVMVGHTDNTVLSVRRFQANGAPDATFGTNGVVQEQPGYVSGSDVALQADGRILVSTNVSDGVGGSQILLLRYGNGEVPAPEIGLLSPTRADLKDGDTWSFGSVGTDAERAVTFTIGNHGSDVLSGLTVSLDGVDAAKFEIEGQPAAELGSRDEATFVVRYVPGTTGAHSAFLHITSDDADEAVFDLKITGTGVKPQNLKPKVLPAYNIAHNAASLYGVINPLGTTPDVVFEYGTSTSFGSITPHVRAPGEPPAISGFEDVLLFGYLTNLQPHTKYHFRLRSAHSGVVDVGPALTFTTTNRGPVAVDDTIDVVPGSKVSLDVLGNDTDADNDELILTAVSALTPKTAGTLTKTGNGLTFAAAAGLNSATFSYTMKDGFGGTATGQVTLNVAGGSIEPAEQTLSSAGTTYDVDVDMFGLWSVNEKLPWVSVASFPDRVSVTVQPNAGNAERRGVIMIGNQAHWLTQAGVVQPSIAVPALVGAAYVGAPYSLTIPTEGFPVTYTTTKMPPGLKIDNASGVISGTPTQGGSFDVTIKAANAAGSSAVVTVTLNVESLPEGAVGSFLGFVARDAILNGDLGSRLEITTTAKGSWTGKIITGVKSVALKGQLAVDPAAADSPTLVVAVPRSGGDPLSLNLTFDGPNHTFDGALSDGNTGNAAVTGWRNTWNAGHRAAAYARPHSFSLEQAGSVADAALPQGFGYGSFTVKETTGGLTVTGALADGSAFATAGFLGKQGQVLIYQPLYTNKGSVAGVLTVTQGAAPAENVVGVDTAAGDTLTWMKPDSASANGFDALDLLVAGGAYLAPAKGEVVMELPNAGGNALLDFSLGGLEDEGADFGQTFSLLNPSATGVTNVASFPGANPNKVTFKVAPATGLFSGEFTLTGSSPALNRKVLFQGQIVWTNTGAEGRGFFLKPAASGGAPATRPKFSGRVLLQEQTAAP